MNFIAFANILSIHLSLGCLVTGEEMTMMLSIYLSVFRMSGDGGGGDDDAWLYGEEASASQVQSF